MKAVVIEKPGIAAIKEVPDPVAQAYEVLLRPHAGGICGTDVHIFEGNFLGKYPVIPCHELSAEIVEIGSAVYGFRVGDRVSVDPNIRCGRCDRCRSGEINLCENYEAIGVTMPGGFAELVCVPAQNVHKIEHCSYETAAFTEPLACVLYGQSRLNFQPGAKVIIWGAGAIGLLHLQACQKLYGAQVTVVDIDKDRIKKAQQMQADFTILSNANLADTFKSICPNGWDIAIDASGSVSALQSLFTHLRAGGQALLFSVYDQAAKLTISPFDIFLNDWAIFGSFTYRHDFATAVQLLDTGLIVPEKIIDLNISFEDVPDVLRRMSEGEKLGKVQVRI